MIIVGAGFSGCVMARQLADAGREVTIYDARNHIGGNAADSYDGSGVLIHPYGPHIFHTNSKRIFEYLSRFTAWRPYRHVTRARVDGKSLPFPINLNTLEELYGVQTENEARQLLGRLRETRPTITTAEDWLYAMIGRELTDMFYRPYSFKQWGLDLSELDISVVSRVPIRMTSDDSYFDDTYQYMPATSYTWMFSNMLSHKNITIKLGTEVRPWQVKDEQVVWTGPIDEFFEFEHGPLPYRSLDLQHIHFNCRHYQKAAIEVWPSLTTPFTRVTEFKKLTGQTHAGSSVCFEVPKNDGEPLYPVPRPANHALLKKYQDMADRLSNVTFVGRLAQYRYYNMDQAVGAALTAADRILGLK